MAVWFDSRRRVSDDSRMRRCLVRAWLGGLGVFVPQVPAVATGFAIIWALAWRRQEGAVAAIEDRDGVRFYVDRTPPFAPIRLIRTPGLMAG